MKNKIIALKAEGKSYRQIQKELGCSRSTISYHCAPGQKEKTRARSKKLRAENTLLRKVCTFKSKKGIRNKTHRFQIREKSGYKKMKQCTLDFTYHDVLEKYKNGITCALTGEKIDLTDPISYQFDHILPVSRGGDNSLENLQLLQADVNQAKGRLTDAEFISVCQRVVAFQEKKVHAEA